MKKLNHSTMRHGWILMIILGGFSAGAMAMASDEAPTSVTINYLQELYAAVEFDHQMHAEAYACNTCHHHTTGDGPENERCARCHVDSGAAENVSCSSCHLRRGGTSTTLAAHLDNTVYHIDKPSIKGALHLQCLSCHQAEDGPTGCQDCHAFSPAGRKRFAVHDKVDD